MKNSRRILTLAIAMSFAMTPRQSQGEEKSPTTVSPDDPRIEYAGFVHKEFVSPPDKPGEKLARFDRILDIAGKGYRWDNPGARIRFRTDATAIEAMLNYNELHVSTSSRNGVGVYSVDGIFKPEWTFQTKQLGVVRQPEAVSVSLSGGAVAGFHDYEIFLPYGDSVDFAGLKVNPEARFEPAKPKPAVRCVAYGDSITHGFSASAVSKTYPFLLGRAKGWEVTDLGLGGRASNPADGKVVASLGADVITVLMGVNDWQGGVPPERYRANMEGFLSNIRSAQPKTPVYLLTPLWVAANWSKPSGMITDLDSYRQILRDLVASRNDPNLHLVEGPDLIDPDPSLFDRGAAVHPNDAGFSMMAERLAEHIHDPEEKP
ncbi:MAG: GDSL-type esterase/lipase family protein [Terrimicrobiaceae bacterium]